MVLYDVTRRLKKSFERDPVLSHSEWAEKNVILDGQKVSPFPGKLRLSRSAHLRKVFEAYDDPKKRAIFLSWASQTGKTFAVTVPIGYKLKNGGGIIHMIYPVKDKVSDLIQLKVDPLLNSMPAVKEMFEDYKEDEKIREKRTIKHTRDGALYITGTTPNDLKSITAQLTVGDEIGEMDAGTIVEAQERQKSFSRVFPRTIGASTLVHPNDEMVDGCNNCECKMEYHLVCRSCGKTFDPNFDTLKIPKQDEGETHQSYINRAKKDGHIECPHCQHKIYSDERSDMLYDGKSAEWVEVDGEFDTAKSVCFKMGSLGSWVVTLESVIEAVIVAGDSPDKLDKLMRNWFNTFYDGAVEVKTDASQLMELSDEYSIGVVPDDTVALYMGVDTQKDHFWATIVAYRDGKRPHIVKAFRPETFGEIWDAFTDTYRYDDGVEYIGGIRRMTIDQQGYVEKQREFDEERGKEVDVITVNRPQEVMEWVYEFGEMAGQLEERERIYATRGQDRLANDAPYRFVDTKVEVGTRKAKRKIKMAVLNTTLLKLSVMSYMNRAILAATDGEAEIDTSKNVMSIAKEYAEAFDENNKLHLFHQLTSEEYGYYGKKQVKGFYRVKKDNHFLDCMVGCEFLATMDRVDKMSIPERDDVVDMKSLFI